MLAVAYATGRASHARQVKGDDPDKKGYPGPPGWGGGGCLAWGKQPHPVKELTVKKVGQRKKLDRLNDDGQKTRYTEITLATWNVQTMLSSSAGSEKMERVGGR